MYMKLRRCGNVEIQHEEKTKTTLRFNASPILVQIAGADPGKGFGGGGGGGGGGLPKLVGNIVKKKVIKKV